MGPRASGQGFELLTGVCGELVMAFVDGLCEAGHDVASHTAPCAVEDVQQAAPDGGKVLRPAAAVADERPHIFAQVLETFCFGADNHRVCLLYTSPSPRDATLSRMPSSA